MVAERSELYGLSLKAYPRVCDITFIAPESIGSWFALVKLRCQPIGIPVIVIRTEFLGLYS